MRSGYTHAAATDGIVGSPGLGRMALAHRAATFPGVSWPSSVVRSMQRMARSSAHSFDDFLIDRLASEAARSSAPTSSTLRTPRMSEPRWVRESAVAIEAIMRRRPGRSDADGLGEDFLVQVGRSVGSCTAVGPDRLRNAAERRYALVVAVLVAEVGPGYGLIGPRVRHLRRRESSACVDRLGEEDVRLHPGRIVAGVVPAQHEVTCG